MRRRLSFTLKLFYSLVERSSDKGRQACSMTLFSIFAGAMGYLACFGSLGRKNRMLMDIENAFFSFLFFPFPAAEGRYS